MSGDALPRAAPAEKGVDPGAIGAFLDAVAADGIELHGLMLYRGGAVIAEGWWSPYRAELPHMQHSLTKSVTATAIGLAIAEGRIALDQPVISFFANALPQGVSDNLAAMTVADLLTMRSGHRAGISGAAWRGLTTDWAAAFLATDVAERPGERFVYSSASSYMLSAILQRATGERIRDYLEPRLFAPLGITRLDWDVAPGGVNPGGNGLSWPTEASLRLGILHLQRGMWAGQRILAENWVRMATRPVTVPAFAEDPGSRRHLAGPAPERGYGHHWWTWPEGAFLASGLFGQYAIVLPAQDAVIAVTAALPSGDERLLDLIWRDLRPALGGNSRDAGSCAGLDSRLRGLALPDLPQGAVSPIAATISGRRFAVAPNAQGIAALTLAFAGRTGRITLEDAAGEHCIEFGLDAAVEGVTSMPGASLHHSYEPGAMRVAATGRWIDMRNFAMRWRFIETAFCDDVLCRFAGDAITFERRVNVNSAGRSWVPITGIVEHPADSELRLSDG